MRTKGRGSFSISGPGFCSSLRPRKTGILGLWDREEGMEPQNGGPGPGKYQPGGLRGRGHPHLARNGVWREEGGFKTGVWDWGGGGKNLGLRL